MYHLNFPGGFKDKIAGKPRSSSEEKPSIPNTVAVNSCDLRGFKPRLKVALGDHVTIGQTLFVSKSDERIKLVAPCSGEIIQIVRGERRLLIDVIIKTDQEQKIMPESPFPLADLSSDKIKSLLLDAGLWPFFRQYPFDVIANPDSEPKDIFIRAAYTEPHSPDLSFVLQESAQLNSAFLLLKRLFKGNIWFIKPEAIQGEERLFPEHRYVRVVNTSDIYPADHPGLLSYQISPLRKNECFWYIDVQDLLEIVHFLATGQYSPLRKIAVGGEAVEKPKQIWAFRGAPLQSLIHLHPDITDVSNVRFLSGGIFTGRQCTPEGHLGFYANSVQAIFEGRQRLFLRWLRPGHAFHSCSRIFLSAFMPPQEFSMNTALFGEERACVQCGACERICPLGLLPSFIYKAILAEDFDMVEELCIRDCIDCGLCTYSCPSKIQLNSRFMTMSQTLKKEEE